LKSAKSVDSLHKNVDFKKTLHKKKLAFTGITEGNVKNVKFTLYYESSEKIKE